MNSEPFFMIIQSRTISIRKVLKHKFKKEIVEHFSRNKKREIFSPKPNSICGSMDSHMKERRWLV